MTLTSDLGIFLENIRFDSIPDEAIELACLGFTDTVGVIMAGINEPIVRIVKDEVSYGPAPREARACLSELWISAPDAALVNGTAAHALDYDDQALTGHPSAILVATILAEGEHLGSTGAEMVTAYVAGYEVWAELIRRNTSYHVKGWHPTSVFGVIGAAAAVAVLRKLPAERASAALALAASHASGLAVNFGTMTKPYHVGMAARAGVISARLAARGATAAGNAFEHRRGYLTAYSPTMEADWDSPSALGESWHILTNRLCIKRYPTCYFMHRSFAATAAMLEGREIQPDDVEDVVVTMGRGQTAVLVNERPQTAHEARFSGQFAMATAVVNGKMTVNELADDVVQKPEIQAFFPKVRLDPIDEYDPRDPAHSIYDRVVIRLKNGEVLDTGKVSKIPGHALSPLSEDELWEKFQECTETTHDGGDARALFDATQRMHELTSTADLKSAPGLFD
ncbi:MmgE/PrpD family protein [Paracoccus sp. P2]|uniref:MmgE/PrpD family protein n=1 Tax=Paracoccus sp. P2 TaxID=3248840 RepID=UPI00391FB9F6